MSAKRALIVDDSKSARLFLARVLENYEIDVDSAESAEAAIDYLTQQPAGRDLHGSPDARHGRLAGGAGHQERSAHRHHPDHDVHLPGGELYLGQARALGRDRRAAQADQAHRRLQGALPAAPGAGPAHAASSRASRPSNVRIAEAPRAPHAACLPSPSPTARCASTSRSCAARWSRRRHPDRPHHRRGARAAARVAAAAGRACRASRRAAHRPWAWIVACLALAIALPAPRCGGAACSMLESLSAQVAQLRAAAGRRPGGAPAASPPTAAARRHAAAAGADAKPIGALVPYGADALGGARLEVIGQLLDRLARQNDAGVVDIRTYAGRFCLMGNGDRWLLAGTGGDALFALRRGRQSRRRGALAAPSASRSRSPTSSATSRSSTPRRTRCAGRGRRSGEPRTALSRRSPRSHGRGVEPRRPAPTTASRSACVELKSCCLHRPPTMTSGPLVAAQPAPAVDAREHLLAARPRARRARGPLLAAAREVLLDCGDGVRLQCFVSSRPRQHAARRWCCCTAGRAAPSRSTCCRSRSACSSRASTWCG